MPWYKNFRTPPLDKVKGGKIEKLMVEKMKNAFQHAVDMMKHKDKKNEPYVVSGKLLVYTKKEWEEYIGGVKTNSGGGAAEKEEKNE